MDRASPPASRSSRSSRTCWWGRAGRRRGGAAQPQCRGSGADPDGRLAGFGQNHHGRQAGPCGWGRRERRRVLLASLDTQRPAAQLQLAQLAEQTGGRRACRCRSRPRPRSRMRKKAMETGRREVFDIVILDTAGRLGDQPGVDGRGACDPGRDHPGRDPAGGGRADRARRSDHGAGVQRGRRRHRHRADADGQRRARRCRAVDARDHRRADQAGRPGREARCAARKSTPSASPPASSAWATSSAWSRRARRDDREGKGGEARGSG